MGFIVKGLRAESEHHLHIILVYKTKILNYLCKSMKTTFNFILGPLLPQQASRPIKKTSNNMAKKHNPKKKGNIPFHQKANRHFF